MLNSIYKNFLRNFNDYLKESVYNFFQTDSSFYAEQKQLCKEAKDSLLANGKRIRPFLVHIGANAYNKTFYYKTKAIKVGIALEAIHSALLIQDDIIDNSLVRRGRVATYKYFSEVYSNRHIGESFAVLVADLLYNFSMYQLSYAGPNFVEVFVKHINNTVLGQASDILNNIKFVNADNNNLNKELIQEQDLLDKVLHVYKYKTAFYTFVLPLELGFMIAKKRLPRKIKKYGYYSGVAYQIIDDILGAFGDPSKTGKDNVSDFKEGKTTILVAYALGAKSALNSTQKQELINLLGNNNLKKSQADTIRSLLQDSGAYTFALEKAKMYLNQAISLVNTSNISPKAKRVLAELTLWIAKRTK